MKTIWVQKEFLRRLATCQCEGAVENIVRETPAPFSTSEPTIGGHFKLVSSKRNKTVKKPCDLSSA